MCDTIHVSTNRSYSKWCACAFRKHEVQSPSQTIPAKKSINHVKKTHKNPHENTLKIINVNISFYIFHPRKKKLKRCCKKNYYAPTTKQNKNMVLSIPLTESEIREIGSPHIVCRSNYKMKCFCCGNPIKRGDLITRCVETSGMKLRAVNLPKGGYIPYTGARWVHVLCDPGIWTEWNAYTIPWIKQKHDPPPKNYKKIPFLFFYKKIEI